MKNKLGKQQAPAIVLTMTKKKTRWAKLIKLLLIKLNEVDLAQSCPVSSSWFLYTYWNDVNFLLGCEQLLYVNLSLSRKSSVLKHVLRTFQRRTNFILLGFENKGIPDRRWQTFHEMDLVLRIM